MTEETVPGPPSLIAMMTYYLGGYCIRGRYCGLGETPLNGKQDIEHLQNLKCHDY
jgi:hypothetical protein